MKKIISVVALVLSFVLLFAACDGNNTTPSDGTTTPFQSADTTTTATVDTTAPTAKFGLIDGKFVICTGGECGFKLIRKDGCETMITDASVDLKNKIIALTGATPGIDTDWVKGVRGNDIVETEDLEILVGITNRKESHDVYDTLADSEYVIKFVNNKLVIIGRDNYATVEAVRIFTETFLSNENKEFAIDAAFAQKGVAPVQKIGLTEGAEMRVMSFNTLGTDSSKGIEYKERAGYMRQLLLDYMPDVVGFQEANKTVQNEVLASKEIREYYSINKTVHGTTSTANYTPILYLKDKYTQVEGNVEWLESRYTGTNTKSLSWSVLERKSDGKRFIVLNMHVALWSTSYTLPAGETHESMNSKAAVKWKLDNVDQMLARVAELKGKYGDIPVFTTGDYNFNTTHSAYAKMTSGEFASSRDAATVSSSKGASFHNNPGQSPSASGSPIDHVFFTKANAEVLKYVICARPLDIKASDHCPVYADVKFIK